MNLGGLLNMSNLSGTGAGLGGPTPGTSGGGGMTGGPDLAELLAMLGSGDEQGAVGMGQQLGTLPTSLAQQQASGQMMNPGFSQPYAIAGSAGSQPTGGSLGSSNQSIDPLAIIQKILGLAQKGVALTGTGGTSLLPSGGGGTEAGGDQTGLSSPTNTDPLIQAFMQQGMQNLSPNDPVTLELLQSMGEAGDTGGDYGASGLDTSGGLGFNPTLGNSLGTLAGLAGLYGGIKNENPVGIAGGAIGTAGNVANMLGYTNAGGMIGGLGGPLSLYSGIQNEDPFGVASGLYGTAQLASGVSGYLGGPTISSLAGLGGAGAGAGTGAGASAAGAGAGAAAGAAGAEAGGATAASLGGALGGMAAGAPMAVAALAPVFHMLFARGGPLATDRIPTSSELSQQAGTRGLEYLGNATQQPLDISQLTQLLNTQFAPHGEVQLGSSPEFGWAGDYDDPASPNWLGALSALRNPDMVGAGLPWVDPFVRNLWVKQGQTGATQTSPNESYLLQSQLARALPMLPSYMPLKASYAPGGDVYQANQPRIDAYNAANAPQVNPYAEPLSEWDQMVAAQTPALRNAPFQGLTKEQETAAWAPYFAALQQPPPVPSTPIQTWQQMLQPAGVPMPLTPQDAAILQTPLARQPGFGAQGAAEDAYLPLLFAQYGLG